MSDISDLNAAALHSAEASNIRVDTIVPASYESFIDQWIDKCDWRKAAKPATKLPSKVSRKS